jgi:Protein of unknown function (DUF1778)
MPTGQTRPTTCGAPVGALAAASKPIMRTGAMNRNDRIELRATKEEKRLLATAAAYERLEVTSFIMRNVLPAARQVS